MSRTFLARWRDAVRDSPLLDAKAKLVALTLATYMDASGLAWPSKATLAEKTATSPKSVDRAVDRIEASGLLNVTRAKYRRGGNKYRAVIPSSVTDAQSTTRATRRPTAAPITREVIKAQNSGVAETSSDAAARWWEATGRLMSTEDARHMLSNHFGLTAPECETFFVESQVAA